MPISAFADGDVTGGLSSYRSAVGSPATSTTTSPKPYTAFDSGSTSSRGDAFHLSDRDMGLTVLFGSKYILDPYSGPTTATISREEHGLPRGPERTVSLVGEAHDAPMPLLDALQFFYDSTPESRAYMQAALFNRGFIKTKGWNSWGEADDTSFNAWKKALMASARSGQTVWQTLTGKKVTMTQFFNGEEEGGKQVGMASAAARAYAARHGGGGGARRAPLTVVYTNPADLKAAARITAQDTIGYVPSEDFLDDFVRLYHGLEAGPQRQAYANAKSVTKAPDVQVAAQEQLKKRYATEATGHSVAKQFNSFLSIIGATS